MEKPSKASAEPPVYLWSLVFLVSFAVYSLTLNPSLFRNDSPETITACVILGVAHPPAYPLHTLLGHIFSSIQIGNPAMTINFFSALIGALGACLFGMNLWQFLGRVRSGSLKNKFGTIVLCLVGSLCFAFSKDYWSVSLAAKGGIYNLQVVLELLLLLFSQHWLLHKTSPYFFAFLFALGLLNHWPTQMLLVPALVLVVFAEPPQKRTQLISPIRPARLLTFLTVIVVVLSLYLFLPIRAHLNPELNFGNPVTWQTFATSLFRANYFKVETLASFIPTALSTIQSKGIYISRRFNIEFSFLFSLLALLGIYFLWKRGLKVFLSFPLFLVFTTVSANLFYLQVSPIEYWHMDDHLLTLNWSVAFLSSIGGFYLLESAGRKISKYAVYLLLFALPLLTLHKSLPFNDQTREFLFHGYGMEALRSMDRNADYFAESDYDYFSILYLRTVEGKRPDVSLKLTTFMAEEDWDRLSKNRTGRAGPLRPIYSSFSNGDFINGYLKHAPTAYFRPMGTVVQFMPPKDTFRQWPRQEPLEDLWDRYLAPGRRSFNPIDGLLKELCAHPYINMADYLRLRGNTDHWVDYHLRALALIQDPQWRAATWAKMAVTKRSQ